MVRTKVFVGNLSFATKETELAKHFEVAGKVISTNIITRGPRSLGYGFVEMDSEADAENAVKLLDKKDIDGRPINVEVAKVREENANTNNTQGQDQSQNQGQQSNRGAARGGRGGRRPRVRRPQDGQGQPQNNQGGNQGQQGNQNQGNQGGNQGQQGQSGQGQRTQGNNNRGRDSNRGTGAPRPPRPARQPRPEGEDNRTPSTTTLFVANLPYALEDEAFSKVLKDGQLAYKTAKVSIKKKSGRSKGFGFIEFETEADQQKALAALHGKKINDRDIVVKVALTGQRESGDANVANKTTSAPVTDVVAPTNKPSEIKANVVAATKQAEKPVTPKQEKK